MLQIRIINSDGSDPVILEGASNKQYSKALNSADEGISFDIAKSDPKANVLDPYSEASFTRFWEVWETRTNERLNFGPIENIDDGGSTYKVNGRGRSALLVDHYQTLKTFYGRIDSIIEEIRYENIAVSPSTTTIVNRLDEDNADENAILITDGEDKYHNLSKKSKDFVIDDNTQYIPFGKTEPPRTFQTTSEYWTGMGTTDSLMLDFGDNYKVSKLRYVFPWWGGPQRATNRTYDFAVKYTVSGADYIDIGGRDLQAPSTLFDTDAYFGESNRIVTTPARPIEFLIGTTLSGTGTNLNTFYVGLDEQKGVDMRYLITNITGVNAWYGNNFDTQASHNGWAFQCYKEYRPGDDPYFENRLGQMTYKKNGVIKEREIPDTEVKPSNDCHASIVEIGAYQEIIEKKSIKPLALQRIDNNNRQISYYRVPDVSELKKFTREGKKYFRFEPGTTFRNFEISWDTANVTYTKFYASDCADCYPNGFNFGVVDDDNTLVLGSDDSAGTALVKGRQYTKHIITKGSNDISLNWVDAWRGKTDPLSWGGSYSYTEKDGDYFTVHFRGESLKWYATIPEGKTGAHVKIELRKKAKVDRRGPIKKLDNIWRPPSEVPNLPDGSQPGTWPDYGGSSDDGWRTLAQDFKLPDGPISNQVVYEIPYNGGLESETVYEFKVTLLDNGYCSVDSIEGYWSASFTEYNEDSSRIILSQPSAFKQIYNKRFTGGSMYKWNKSGAGISMQFEGDRLIIQSARGRNHGKLTLLLFQYSQDGAVEYDPGVDNHIFIPGGDLDSGELTIDLDTGKRGQEIPNAIIFDSNDYFTNGLPWGKYTISLTYRPAAKYTTTKSETGSDTFQYRCRDCNPKTGEKSVEIYKYVYLDAIGVHERVGVSVNFEQQTHLDILKSLADAIQMEWDAAEDGLMFEPRLGRDTDIALREGENTLVSYQIANDLSKVATKLLSYGSAVDGIDMFAITEDKKSKRLFGRTITRQQDFRDVGSYQQLIGLSRMELKRRNRPERRVSVKHVADNLDLVRGDSFILWTVKSGPIRLRIQRLQISEGSSGREYELECVEWPQIT